MNPWLIHIGYRKCGSTWMQRRMFPAMSGIDFIGKRYDEPGLAWLVDLRDALIKRHCFDFSPEEVHALIEQHARPEDGRMRVLSFEGFSGEVWRGSMDSKRNADRLQQTFPGAKILIVVRRQVAHLESLYKQYLLTGGVLPIGKFITADIHHLQFSIDSLQYDRLAEYYIRLFGRENVAVLPFELLTSNAQDFSNAVCDFCEIPRISLGEVDKEYVRRGYTARQCAYVRRLNAWRKSSFNPLGLYQKPSSVLGWESTAFSPYTWADVLAAVGDRVLGPYELLGAKDKARLAEHFRAGNERLAALFPVLNDYGYADASSPVPTPTVLVGQ
jgi:hypothetical protein